MSMNALVQDFRPKEEPRVTSPLGPQIPAAIPIWLYLAAGFGCQLILLSGIGARTWTANDGRTLEADFLSANETEVTVRNSAGNDFTIPLERLSEVDKAWLKAKTEERKRPKRVTGPYADKITGDWAKAMWENRLAYRIYGKDLDANQKYPLVIFLHGRGGEGSDNEKHLGNVGKVWGTEDFYAKHPSIAVVPQCYDRGDGWGGKVAEDLIDLIEDMVENLPIDTSRIYITGYSMGAYGCWHLMGQEPDLFAAAIPVAGGGDPGDARKMKQVAIWAFHGDQDPTVPASQSRDMVEAVKRARGNIKYTEMPGEGHAISGKVFFDPDVREWLFAQKREQ